MVRWCDGDDDGDGDVVVVVPNYYYCWLLRELGFLDGQFYQYKYGYIQVQSTPCCVDYVDRELRSIITQGKLFFFAKHLPKLRGFYVRVTSPKMAII